MAEKHGFFNSTDYADNEYAEALALITNNAGYVVGFMDELAVAAGVGLQVIIASGGAWLGDPPGWWYINDDTLELNIDAEVDGYSRIDRVVLQLDRNSDALSIAAVIKKGAASASEPAAPALTQNSTVYEYALASVLVTGGVTAVTVEDERDASGRITLNAAPGEVIETDSFTLSYKHLGRLVKCNKTTAMTVTIPANTKDPLPIKSEAALYRYGAGTVTIVPAEGVTVRAPNGADEIASQYGACALRKVGADEWLLSGAIA